MKTPKTGFTNALWRKKMLLVMIMLMVFVCCLSSVSANLLNKLIWYIPMDNITQDGNNQTFLNIHDTSIYNGTNIYADGQRNQIRSVNGTINNGTLFSNNAMFFQTSSAALDSNNGSSFSIWFNGKNYTEGAGTIRIISYVNGAFGFKVEKLSGHTYALYYGNGATWTASFFELMENNWYHMVGVWNGTRALVYLNGTLYNTSATSGVYVPTGVPYMFLGTTGSSNFFNGTMDEFGFWNRSLTVEEVSLLYNSGKGSPYPFGISVNLENYSASTYDTKNETFIINISYDPTLYVSATANLIYDGTTYVSSGINNYFSKTIDIPAVNIPTNKTFYWSIKLVSAATGYIYLYESTEHKQLVYPSIFSQCNLTYPVMGINYTIYNENTLNLTSATFKSNFKWYLGSGSVTKNISYDLVSNTTFKFCISPNLTYYVKPTIKLSANGFYDRSYSFFDTISNITTHRKLYLLDTTNGTNIILEWKDVGLKGIIGNYMQINRYYSELNDYISIHQDLTDNFGQVVGSLIENSVKYNFKFYDANYNLIKTTNDVVIACRSTICMLTFLKDSVPTDFDRFKNITNYEYSLTFNNNTNIFIYTWNDNTGVSPFHRLIVERTSANGTTIVCNSSSTDASSSLSCAVDSAYASYRAQAYRYASPERRVAVLSIKVGDITAKFGKEGLLWSFILTMTMVAIGCYNPTVGISLYLGSMILLGVIGIIYVNPAIIIAELVLGIAFIWSFRS